ncbi:hypothetical protein BELL_0141g00100 [Botrytis elliptica]|uniref:Uncharacterized protein n=1 Tax=Botrytis elliptica TaxID=278938 RepID=A0A4Z1JTT8_9HELO|nr:hypothetical protein BELL_0141g00100 [Botrytis elliptica]
MFFKNTTGCGDGEIDHLASDNYFQFERCAFSAVRLQSLASILFRADGHRLLPLHWSSELGNALKERPEY